MRTHVAYSLVVFSLRKLEFGNVSVRAGESRCGHICGLFKRWRSLFPFGNIICYLSADGMSGCSVMLDDSVSEEEEEEGSFDELTDVTPYLQPGVELSVLNEVRRGGAHV